MERNVKKLVKNVLTNPYLLGAQGFVAGALLLWAAPAPGSEMPVATSADVQLVPPVS